MLCSCCLNNVYENKTWLGNVYMIDELPKNMLKNECAVVNYYISTNHGTHWVCYFKENNDVCYFDSFGGNIPNNLINYFTNNNAITMIIKFKTLILLSVDIYENESDNVVGEHLVRISHICRLGNSFVGKDYQKSAYKQERTHKKMFKGKRRLKVAERTSLPSGTLTVIMILVCPDLTAILQVTRRPERSMHSILRLEGPFATHLSEVTCDVVIRRQRPGASHTTIVLQDDNSGVVVESILNKVEKFGVVSVVALTQKFNCNFGNIFSEEETVSRTTYSVGNKTSLKLSGCTGVSRRVVWIVEQLDDTLWTSVKELSETSIWNPEAWFTLVLTAESFMDENKLEVNFRKVWEKSHVIWFRTVARTYQGVLTSYLTTPHYFPDINTLQELDQCGFFIVSEKPDDVNDTDKFLEYIDIDESVVLNLFQKFSVAKLSYSNAGLHHPSRRRCRNPRFSGTSDSEYLEQFVVLGSPNQALRSRTSLLAALGSPYISISSVLVSKEDWGVGAIGDVTYERILPEVFEDISERREGGDPSTEQAAGGGGGAVQYQLYREAAAATVREVVQRGPVPCPRRRQHLLPHPTSGRASCSNILTLRKMAAERESEILTEMDLPTLCWTLPPIGVKGFNLLTNRMARYVRMRCVVLCRNSPYLVKLSLHEAEEYPRSRTLAGLQKRLK
ncbi:hypothetical protein PR048_028005 [Dryococelus australis]|uniref:Uncharacterized protein n=1 Tax=Dryococelus australis TaxID=614101 RepID=A0ABQ9GI20_9NEOP|nr:hypothetical protein PR048_028005 [Dryococelus australis]